MIARITLCLAAFFLSGAAAQNKQAPRCKPGVVASYPHDRQAFTQGLLYRDGHLYESTGYEGRSTIRKVRLADGAVLRKVDLPPDLFGEGLVDWNNELVSITWRNGKGFRWDFASFRRKSEFRYAGEGWGLTRDDRRLIMSDGTAVLRFLDPATFRQASRVAVTLNGSPLSNLNELEWVDGEIFANVWMTDAIVRIDPASGTVKSVLDLSDLKKQIGATGSDAVLNGIAYDRTRKRLFVTGKYWPKLFEISLKAC